MIEIRNLQFQPFSFNLDDGRTMHLGPRERTAISEKDISHEIRLAERRGLIRLEKQEEKQSAAPAELADSTTTKTAKRKK